MVSSKLSLVGREARCHSRDTLTQPQGRHSGEETLSCECAILEVAPQPHFMALAELMRGPGPDLLPSRAPGCLTPGTELLRSGVIWYTNNIPLFLPDPHSLSIPISFIVLLSFGALSSLLTFLQNSPPGGFLPYWDPLVLSCLEKPCPCGTDVA